MKLFLFCFGLLCCTTAAFPQAAEVSVHGGVALQSNSNVGILNLQNADGTLTPASISLKDGFRLGFRFTLNTQRYFGHEVGYAYNRSQLHYGLTPPQEQGFGIHQGFYNYLIYGVREGSRVRPFITGGVHFNNYTPPGSSASNGGGSTKFGVNYGAGIKFRIGDRFAIRFDARQYQNPKPFDLQGKSGWIRMTEASAGFGIVL